MIIKSHIRGGYRAAAEYLKDQGFNEKVRLVEISDPSAKNLDEAFQNMWVVASNSKATKPLHHISINPMKDERLTDKQVLAIVERCEQKYGYSLYNHQRVIVEHIKDGRQHFHVVWNRVSLVTGKAVCPGKHWNKSKEVCREMEKELGLKSPTANQTRRQLTKLVKAGRVKKIGNRYELLRAEHKGLRSKTLSMVSAPLRPFIRPILRRYIAPTSRPSIPPPMIIIKSRHRYRKDINNRHEPKLPVFRRDEWTTAELIAWAWANGRVDILAQFGIYLTPDYFEP